MTWTRERWAQIESVFHDAAQRDAAERAAYLGVACGDDHDLRAAVTRLPSISFVGTRSTISCPSWMLRKVVTKRWRPSMSLSYATPRSKPGDQGKKSRRNGGPWEGQLVSHSRPIRDAADRG